MGAGGKVIHVVAILVQDFRDNILLVRKRNTDMFIQPGGKPEKGEDMFATGARELAEETSLRLAPEQFEFIGEFTAPAANEPGYSIVAQCLRVRLERGVELQVREANEIAQAEFFSPGSAQHITGAPLFKEIILPMVLAEQAN